MSDWKYKWDGGVVEITPEEKEQRRQEILKGKKLRDQQLNIAPITTADRDDLQELVMLASRALDRRPPLKSSTPTVVGVKVQDLVIGRLLDGDLLTVGRVGNPSVILIYVEREDGYQVSRDETLIPYALNILRTDMVLEELAEV